MDLEVARADRRLDPVAVAARLRERLRRPPTRTTPKKRSTRRSGVRRAPSSAPQRLRLERDRPELPAARAAGPGSVDGDAASPRSSTSAGAVPASPTTTAPSGTSACLRTPGCELGVRPAQPLRDRSASGPRSAPRAPGRGRAAGRPRARAARPCGRRGSGRARPRRRAGRGRGPLEAPLASSAAASPTMRTSSRLDAEREQRPGEERPVQVGAVAAHELGARDDDRSRAAGSVGVPARSA